MRQMTLAVWVSGARARFNIRFYDVILSRPTLIDMICAIRCRFFLLFFGCFVRYSCRWLASDRSPKRWGRSHNGILGWLFMAKRTWWWWKACVLESNTWIGLWTWLTVCVSMPATREWRFVHCSGWLELPSVANGMNNHPAAINRNLTKFDRLPIGSIHDFYVFALQQKLGFLLLIAVDGFLIRKLKRRNEVKEENDRRGNKCDGHFFDKVFLNWLNYINGRFERGEKMMRLLVFGRQRFSGSEAIIFHFRACWGDAYLREHDVCSLKSNHFLSAINSSTTFNVIRF